MLTSIPTRHRRLSILIVPGAALIIAAGIVPALAQPQTEGALSFSMSPRGHILVPVSVNDRGPFVFVLDTAAGQTTVTSALAEELALEPVLGESAKMLGVHGLTENPVVQIQSLAVGDAEVRDDRAVILDLGHITRGEWKADGILGMDFLSQFDLSLDFGAQSLMFAPSGMIAEHCAAGLQDREAIAFDVIEPGFVVLPVTVDGHPVSAILDTGSGHSGLNGKAAALLGVELPALPQGPGGGHGFGLQTGPVGLGDRVLAERTTLRVMDHPVMEALGLADDPSMLMGNDLLAGRKLTICYQSGTAFIQ